ncbi:hypothetical protein [Pseudomonas koreensis]|nr:hypothetical protein [Pseudomonas koreensis]NNA54210.1 hypothetical protein [Pseudomonas koreensis]
MSSRSECQVLARTVDPLPCLGGRHYYRGRVRWLYSINDVRQAATSALPQ